MPFTNYKAYIHFVDNHNIITNGIYLKDICSGVKIKLNYVLTSIFYLIIKNIVLR